MPSDVRWRAAPRLVRAATVFTLLALSAARPGAQEPGGVRDLPLTEVPAARPGATTLAVLVTGDGGWAEIDRMVAQTVAEHGVGVVGLNARAYLSRAPTPDQAAADVARVARGYLERWGGRRLVRIGYSRGADVLPFVVSRLPADLRERTALVALLGLASTESFQFHWSDLVTNSRRAGDLSVAPELAKLRGMRLLCVYGTEEQDSGCRDADPALVTPYGRPGGHHFDGDFRALGDLILGALAP